MARRHRFAAHLDPPPAPVRTHEAVRTPPLPVTSGNELVPPRRAVELALCCPPDPPYSVVHHINSSVRGGSSPVSPPALFSVPTADDPTPPDRDGDLTIPVSAQWRKT